VVVLPSVISMLSTVGAVWLAVSSFSLASCRHQQRRGLTSCATGNVTNAWVNLRYQWLQGVSPGYSIGSVSLTSSMAGLVEWYQRGEELSGDASQMTHGIWVQVWSQWQPMSPPPEQK
jgi:hypothetical protein